MELRETASCTSGLNERIAVLPPRVARLVFCVDSTCCCYVFFGRSALSCGRTQEKVRCSFGVLFCVEWRYDWREWFVQTVYIPSSREMNKEGVTMTSRQVVRVDVKSLKRIRVRDMKHS